MARFAFSMQASLAGLFGRSQVSERSLCALCFDAGGGEPPSGSGGWWDSSYELRRGLEVHEGLPSDTPLEDWLALWLCTAKPAALTAPTHHHHSPV